ncbi:hypothetical protein RI578_35195 [Streptomyces sp. BB1-1-1]|uniref:hypothetical protein n=1 Tax=Streptomyces sp. BB1-1-1 TaxID=3074430 RepID=UPI00287767DC|nr:hypothetical protein [Streptomyces sp. BB1-1-1]WND39220.1 hypothetical protein RI578_35195 [Streptomyces sp. BB1-1-1]
MSDGIAWIGTHNTTDTSAALPGMLGGAGYRTVESMRPAPDEEIVCVTTNQWSPPQRIIHAPGDGHAWQENGPRLPAAVFTAVGDYCGLSIDQEAVQAGDLPAVLIPMVGAADARSAHG